MKGASWRARSGPDFSSRSLSSPRATGKRRAVVAVLEIHIEVKAAVQKRPMQVKTMVGGMKVKNILMQMIMGNGMISASPKSFQHTFKILLKYLGW